MIRYFLTVWRGVCSAPACAQEAAMGQPPARPSWGGLLHGRHGAAAGHGQPKAAYVPAAGSGRGWSLPVRSLKHTGAGHPLRGGMKY